MFCHELFLGLDPYGPLDVTVVLTETELFGN